MYFYEAWREFAETKLIATKGGGGNLELVAASRDSMNPLPPVSLDIHRNCYHST